MNYFYGIKQCHFYICCISNLLCCIELYCVVTLARQFNVRLNFSEVKILIQKAPAVGQDNFFGGIEMC